MSPNDTLYEVTKNSARNLLNVTLPTRPKRSTNSFELAVEGAMLTDYVDGQPVRFTG